MRMRFRNRVEAGQMTRSHAAASMRWNSCMELPIQISYRNMESSDAVTTRIEAEVAKLDTFFDRITSCRVVVEAPHRHHKWGELFHVRIELGVPGTEPVVSHEPTPRATLSHDEGAARCSRRPFCPCASCP